MNAQSRRFPPPLQFTINANAKALITLSNTVLFSCGATDSPRTLETIDDSASVNIALLVWDAVGKTLTATCQRPGNTPDETPTIVTRPSRALRPGPRNISRVSP